MVGVPGKSKGCNTCRQRKIACGLQRPQCEQCTKSNRVCTGYQRKRVFITSYGNTSSVSKITFEANSGVQPYQRSGINVTGTAPAADISGRRLSKKKALDSTAHTTTQLQLHLGQQVGPHVAYRRQLMNAFLASYLPLAQLGPLGHTPWLVMLAELPAPTIALETAVMAICCAWLSRGTNDQAMRKHSLFLYTQGLQELQKALWDSNQMYKDETETACMLLGMYELMECPAKTRYGYMSHYSGCGRLIELRGPEAHTTGLGHQVFLTFRSQGLLQAIAEQKSSFLSDPAWMEIPWASRSKNSFDQLLDVLASAPVLLAQAAQFSTLQYPELVAEILRISNEVWKLDRQLERFYKQLEDKHLGPLYWPEFSQESTVITGNEDQGMLFPVAFHFIDLPTANMLLFYWALLTMLWGGMIDLYGLASMVPALPGMSIPTHSDTTRDTPSTSTASTSNTPIDIIHESQPSTSSTQSSPSAAAGLTSTPISNADTSTPPPALPTMPTFLSSLLPPLGERASLLTPIRNVCQSIEFCLQEKMMSVGPALTIAPLSIIVGTAMSKPGYEKEVAWAVKTLHRVKERGWNFLQYD